MIQAYRRQWLRQHAKYENKARIIFQKEFKRIANTIPYDTMTADNYPVFTDLYVSKDEIFTSYLEVYRQVGGLHGKRVGREINKQINEKFFNLDAFDDEFQKTLIRWLTQFGGDRITSVRENFISYINEIIKKGVDDNKSISQISTSLTRQIKSRNFYRWQALRIARTETTTAANYSATVASSVSGVLMDKVWISSQDNRTRRPPESRFDHYSMNKKRVKLEEPFNVNGELIMFVGAPTTKDGARTSAQNVVNCRCVNAQLVRKDKDGRAIRADDNKPKIFSREQEISNYENTIRNNDFETARFYDGNGNIVFTKKGTKHAVDLTKEEQRLIKDTYMTHNHPGRIENSFSPDDIYISLLRMTKETRAVTRNRTFIMQPIKQIKTKKEFDAFKRHVSKNQKEVSRDLSQQLRNKKITREQYDNMYWDNVWSKVSSQGKYKDYFKYIAR